jgi:stress response protein SCP2
MEIGDSKQLGKVKDYFVFYNNLKSPDGSGKHLGDNTTGQGEGAVVDAAKYPILENK